MKNRTLLLVVGAGFLLLSFYFAFFLNFNHFYEFLLAGLFFILFPFTKKYFENTRLFTALYLSFIALGLFVDLLIGLSLFDLWHYSYSNLSEYILLYAVVYPLGGLVMLQSFLLGRSFARVENADNVGNLKTGLVILTFVLLAFTAFLIVSAELFIAETWAVMIAVSIVILGIVSINTLSEFRSEKSYARELLKSPRKVIFVTLSVTYLNAFIHEYPNIFADQWIYTAYVNSFLDTPVFGIPLLILLVWPTLTIAPASVYYFLESNFN